MTQDEQRWWSKEIQYCLQMAQLHHVCSCDEETEEDDEPNGFYEDLFEDIVKRSERDL